MPAPDWLDDHGKEFWNRYVPILVASDRWRDEYVAAFETMADCYSQFRRAQKVLDEKGFTFTTPNGYEQQRPEYSIAAKNKEQLRLMLQEFGMTELSRTRIDPDSEGGGKGPGEDWSGTGLDR